MTETREMALVLDFNGHDKETAARLIRRLGVYSEIRPGSVGPEAVKNLNPVGIVVTGAPGSETWFRELGIPVYIDTDGKYDKLSAFLTETCGAKALHNVDSYIERQIEAIRGQVGSEKVLLALSGGVDSSVCAALLSKAIPGQLHCIFVDHGLMRLGEGDMVETAFSRMNLDFIRINAEERFLNALKGVTDPEKKRKIVGSEFIAVFREEARKLGDIRFLAQGTIYPDIVESGWNGASVKSHHNVGGLPEELGFKELVEPLSGLFKDEVREMGRRLKLSSAFVNRQPFPGPGLCVRVIGEVTKEKLETLRLADAIFREEVDKAKKKPGQYFAVHTGINSVGVKNGVRSYGSVIALRAVDTQDYMTCEYTKLSHTRLSKAASRILDEVPGAGRVVYDITSKPPGTIEWE